VAKRREDERDARDVPSSSLFSQRALDRSRLSREHPRTGTCSCSAQVSCLRGMAVRDKSRRLPPIETDATVLNTSAPQSRSTSPHGTPTAVSFAALESPRRRNHHEPDRPWSPQTGSPQTDRTAGKGLVYAPLPRAADYRSRSPLGRRSHSASPLFRSTGRFSPPLVPNSSSSSSSTANFPRARRLSDWVNLELWRAWIAELKEEATDPRTGSWRMPPFLRAYVPLLVWAAVSIVFAIIVLVWHEQVFSGAQLSLFSCWPITSNPTRHCFRPQLAQPMA
jgi:hypothetical protein